MTRLAVIFFVAFTLLGALFYVWKSDTDEQAVAATRMKDLEEKMNAKGIVVYAIRDIPEGALITADALEQRAVAQSKIPQTALSLSSVAVGKKAKYGIISGQILAEHDLDPPIPGLGKIE
ncbi:MAG: SAF domain-containing protein [Candidatus Melainabacteria bacterium]|nr:SAF domain-containing protein [Candidatus Melainabacteria bacterium]